jgi:hypothetical protein
VSFLFLIFKQMEELIMARKFKTSFAEWMITNLGEDSLEKYWSDKNEISPCDISYGSNSKRIWIECQKTDYHGAYDTTPKNFVSGNRCAYCYAHRLLHPRDSFAQWGIDNICEDFLEKYWSNKNTISPWEISARNDKKIYIKCQNKDYHEDYPTTPHRFSSQERRCSLCSGRGEIKIHPNDSLASLHPEVLKLWSNKNMESPFQSSPKSNKNTYWKCNEGIHDDYERTIKLSNFSNFLCPECIKERDESFLQEKVRIFVSEVLGFKIKHEYHTNLKCINPKTDKRLPYDNEVSIDNFSRLIIEVHGMQHYKISNWTKAEAERKGISPHKELEYIQWKDNFKKEFALSEGCCYLAIPYWTDNEQDEWKQLIIAKLNTMKNNQI